jgi:hypothetical protein
LLQDAQPKSKLEAENPVAWDLILRCLNGSMDPASLTKHVLFQSCTYLAKLFDVIGGIIVDGKEVDTDAQDTAQEALKKEMDIISGEFMCKYAWIVEVRHYVGMLVVCDSTVVCSLLITAGEGLQLARSIMAPSVH